MKTLTTLSLALLALTITVTGCNNAKEAIDKTKELANVDFGDFDMKGLQEKFTGITDGFKDVSADNADGLVGKISGLTGSLDGMGIGKLSGPAKMAVGKAISTFVAAVEKAMEGISDDGILSKLKPVVGPLLEKLKAFG